MMTEHTRVLLALSYLKGIGRKGLLQLIQSFRHESEDIFALFTRHKQYKNKYGSDDISRAFAKADEQISIAEDKGHRILSYVDQEYPDTLRVIDDPPIILFCAGNISLLRDVGVSIIGTREPTEHGVDIAQKLTKWAVLNKWVVTSGLAKGIDTQAHKASINASGHTIAVLAHGLEKVYPAENKELAKLILKSDGLLISEYPYNSFVGKSNFVERDRIQAALSRAVILVQSGVKGGSLHASRAALQYGRYLVVAGQSKTDELENQSKIEANLILLKGTDLEKSRLLKKNPSELYNLLALYHKEFYPIVQNKIQKHQVMANVPITDSLL
ncbi:DNA-processing protein DprA [Idiomarina sp.]|uniref:DNA-processing protein DprA n=1 Tax=Idiomarina sp. TaxID=1874361 RepID=UPI00262B8A6D|nr:DNA-processing protein DprA [Idiomarina sp.]